MRKCRICEKTLEDKLFKNSLIENCKQCLKTKRKTLRIRKRLKQLKEYPPELVIYFQNIWKNYRLTPEWYFETLEKQNNKCDICKKEPKLNKNGRPNFFVDHNHGTNQIRGLLCSQCNSLIGFALENPHTLENAIKYLGKHNL